MDSKFWIVQSEDGSNMAKVFTRREAYEAWERFGKGNTKVEKYVLRDQPGLSAIYEVWNACALAKRIDKRTKAAEYIFSYSGYEIKEVKQ